jgi:aminomethyltransferase
LFDISHMGRIRFDGPGAASFLDSLLTRHVAPLSPGQVAYSLVTNEEGGILDDVLVYRLQDAAQTTYYLLVVNASNREKIVSWINQHRSAARDVTISDATREWGMIAVQGPRALEIVQPLVKAELGALDYYSATETLIAGHGGIASRTGYTGEDGCELVVPAEEGERVWDLLLEGGRSLEPTPAMPAGLGARDTLRLEAAMPLYGHELNEQINPFQAGLKFAVQLEGREFIGRDALTRAQNDPSLPVRVGLELAGRRAAREGYRLFLGERQVGTVTSGSFSPTLEKSIAMAYVARERSATGSPLEVDIRGRREAARVVKLPFYRRSKESPTT